MSELSQAAVRAALRDDVDFIRGLPAESLHATTGPGELTLLMLAAGAGSEQVVRYLLGAQVPLDAKSRGGETALIWAAARRRARVVRLLLEAGARVDVQDACGCTALIRALGGSGNEAELEDVVRALLDAGADPFVQDYSGRTAFSAARRKTTDWRVPCLGWDILIHYPVRRRRIIRILKGARAR